MRKLIETFKNSCKKRKIRFEQLSDNTLRTGFIGDNGNFDSYVDIYEDIGQITVRTISPIKAPRNKWLQVAEITTLANAKVRYGSFELSDITGHFAFKTNIMLGSAELHEDIVEHLIYANWLHIDRYFPAISAVIFGNDSPKEAIDGLNNPKDVIKKSSKVEEFNLKPDNISKILRGRLEGLSNN